jgi:prepilin-type N-terminal cleavage/methylation domain-containing protein
MTRNRQRLARRGMTILEVIVALSVFSVILIAVGNMFMAAGDVSNVVNAQTQCQMDAERCLDQVKQQLLRSSVGGGGNIQVNNTASGIVDWEIAYTPIAGAGDIFDPLAPNGAALWAGPRFVLKFEHPTDAVNGTDDDGDFVIDDGRLRLYRRAGTDIFVSELASEVRSFVISPLNQTDGGPRSRILLDCTVERVYRNLLTNTAEVLAAKAGNGPRARHRATVWLTLN